MSFSVPFSFKNNTKSGSVGLPSENLTLTFHGDTYDLLTTEVAVNTLLSEARTLSRRMETVHTF